MYHCHKRGHKCYFEASNRGLREILPYLLIICLRTPILFDKREILNLRKWNKKRGQRDWKWGKFKAA